MFPYTQFVWTLFHVLMLCSTALWFSEATAVNHHEEISSLPEGLIRGSRDVIRMHKSRNVNGCWCRRCLRIQDDEASPPVAVAAPPPSVSIPEPVPEPPLAAIDLPTLPTDPDSQPPPSPRTNPSSLLPLSGSGSGPSVPGASSLGNGSSSGTGSLAGKVGFSAGVGLSAGVGVGVLLLGVLYYFKPDVFFLCCKTCVRVQVFHHSANANSKK